MMARLVLNEAGMGADPVTLKSISMHSQPNKLSANETSERPATQRHS